MKTIREYINLIENAQIIFQRGQHDYSGGIPNSSDGQAGPGIYAFPASNSAMRKYYTKDGETLINIVPKESCTIIDFTKAEHANMAIDVARKMSPTGKTSASIKTLMTHPWALRTVATRLNADGYIVPHRGQGIPSGTQLVIINPDAFSYEPTVK
jgi:hypothetical protein